MTPVIPVDYGALLNSARSAMHDLMTGKAIATVVDQNGERIEYAKADLGKLTAYVSSLESLAGVSRPVLGPLGAFF